ncbi:unnamed protein product [Moneuplotes crassus]|uniref:CHAT domain-containing protein n=1 Tax=Euplotes crassus TaxID=5936 RepID=A0AAD1Y219_EUPCR|nr:unnamed protein product [Moneuplotes crassus]
MENVKSIETVQHLLEILEAGIVDCDGKIIEDYEGNRYEINIGQNEDDDQYFESRLSSYPKGMSLLSMKKAVSVRSDPKKKLLELENRNPFVEGFITHQNSFNYSNRVDLVFAFASPLTIQIGLKDKENELAILNHSEEFKVIDNSLRNLISNLNYKKILATIQNLRDVCSTKPMILHFSGHGLVKGEMNAPQDSLVVEKECLKGELLTESKISEIFHTKSTKRSMSKAMQLVVVLSCHSEKVGKIFRNAGVNHVICIKRECEVLDNACLTFTRTFYKYLLTGNWNKICEAFEAGKRAVSDKFKSEAYKFLCLCNHGKKKCDVGFSFIDGETNNLSNAIKIKALPDKNKNIFGRTKDMVKIMDNIQSKHVWLTGEYGIGKSAIVKELCHLVYDRDLFKQGVLYIPLKNVQDFESLVDKLFRTMMYSFVNEEDKKFLESKMNDEVSHMYHSCFSCIKNYEILIILDNCDDYMRHNENNFRRLVKDITQKVQNTKILLTSQKVINIETEINILAYPIIGLEDKDMHKLIIPPNKSKNQINKEFIDMCKETLKIDNPDLDDVYKHEFFKMLNGNPLCGLLVSSNAHSMSMLDIYKKISEIQSRSGRKGNSNISMMLAIQMSLEYLESESPEIIQVLRHLSLCPSGLSDHHIKAICKDWSRWVDLLKDRSLITEKEVFNEDYRTKTRKIFRRSSYEGESTTKLYCIDPSLAKFIEDSIAPSKKLDYDEKVAGFMVNTLKELLSASEEKLGLIELYEQNLWIALSRLEARKIATTGGSFINTTLDGGFTLQSNHFMKERNNKNMNIIRNQTLLGKPTFSYKKKANSFQTIVKPSEKKDVFDLCFTGGYGKKQEPKLESIHDLLDVKEEQPELTLLNKDAPDRLSLQGEKKRSKPVRMNMISGYQNPGGNMESIDELEEGNMSSATNLGFFENPTFSEKGESSSSKIFHKKNNSKGSDFINELLRLDPIQDIEETESVSDAKSFLFDFKGKANNASSEKTESEILEESDDLDRAESSSEDEDLNDSDDLDRQSISEKKQSDKESKSTSKEEEKQSDSKSIDFRSEDTCDLLKAKDQLSIKNKAPTHNMRTIDLGSFNPVIKIEPLDQDLSKQAEIEEIMPIKKIQSRQEAPSEKNQLEKEGINVDGFQAYINLDFEKSATRNLKSLSSSNLTTSFKTGQQSENIHTIKVYDQMVILFATLLLKLNRLKDCFTVLNTYGRKCLQDDKLTRANMYKILTMATLDTKTEGYTAKALKHCEKAIEKFTLLNSKEGLSSCLLLKLHILQIIKYAEDPLDSDSDDVEACDNEGGDVHSKNSRINSIFEQFYLEIRQCRNSLFSRKIDQIITYIQKFQKNEEVLDFTKNDTILKFLFRPVLSSTIQKVDETPCRSVRKNIDPSTELFTTQVEKWMEDYDFNIKRLQDKIPQTDSFAEKAMLKQNFWNKPDKKFKLTKTLIDFLEKRVFTSISDMDSMICEVRECDSQSSRESPTSHDFSCSADIKQSNISCEVQVQPEYREASANTFITQKAEVGTDTSIMMQNQSTETDHKAIFEDISNQKFTLGKNYKKMEGKLHKNCQEKGLNIKNFKDIRVSEDTPWRVDTDLPSSTYSSCTIDYSASYSKSSYQKPSNIFNEYTATYTNNKSRCKNYTKKPAKFGKSASKGVSKWYSKTVTSPLRRKSLESKRNQPSDTLVRFQPGMNMSIRSPSEYYRSRYS